MDYHFQGSSLYCFFGHRSNGKPGKAAFWLRLSNILVETPVMKAIHYDYGQIKEPATYNSKWKSILISNSPDFQTKNLLLLLNCSEAYFH